MFYRTNGPSHAAQQLLKVGKVIWPKLCGPFALDHAEDFKDLSRCGVTTRGQVHNARTAFARCVCSLQVSKIFEAAQQPVHSLLADAGALGQHAGAIYGLSGILTVTVDGKAFAVGSGQVICISTRGCAPL